MTQYSFHCTHTESKVGVVLYRYVFKRLTYLNRFVPDIPPYYAKRITLNRTYYLIWSVAKHVTLLKKHDVAVLIRLYYIYCINSIFLTQRFTIKMKHHL